MIMAENKQRMSLTVHEILGIGTVIVAITASFVFLRADVMSLSKEVGELHSSVHNVMIEQAKMKATLDLLYTESLKDRNGQGYGNNNGNNNRIP